MRLLVGYATAHGSTRGVAERVAAGLEAPGHTVDVLPVADVNGVDDYDAVVVGSPVYNQSWLPQAEAFVHQNATALAGVPLWLFSVGTFGDTKRVIGPLMKREPRGIQSTLDGLRPRDYRVFAGVIDRHQWPFFSRIFFHALGGRLGDNRDWAQIDAWAARIARDRPGIERAAAPAGPEARPSARPILAAWDGSAEARDAIALAADLAREFDARLQVVHIGPLHAGLPEFEPAMEAAARELLDQAPMELLAGLDAERHLVRGRSPAEGIHRAIEQFGAQLVVLGSTHRGPLGRLIPGTVADHLLHGSPCAVAIAPVGYADEAPHSLRTVGLAYDGFDEAKAAAASACELATRAEGTMRVISVATPPTVGWSSAGLAVYPPPETADDRREDCRRKLDDLLATLPSTVRAEGRLISGQAGPAIASECESGVDLLVMGSRGYGAIGRVLLGSVSSEVIREAPCPILVIPQSAAKAYTQGDAVREPEAASV